jgi:hypothetical protein
LFLRYELVNIIKSIMRELFNTDESKPFHKASANHLIMKYDYIVQFCQACNFIDKTVGGMKSEFLCKIK